MRILSRKIKPAMMGTKISARISAPKNKISSSQTAIAVPPAPAMAAGFQSPAYFLRGCRRKKEGRVAGRGELDMAISFFQQKRPTLIDSDGLAFSFRQPGNLFPS